MNSITIYNDDEEVIGWARWDCECPGAIGKMHLIPRTGTLSDYHPKDPIQAILDLK